MPGRKFSIYILQLGEGKRYVGKIQKRYYEDRIKKHYEGKANNRWTKRYRPIQKNKGVIKVYHKQHSWMQDNLTKNEMLKIGIRNVRGGKYAYYADQPSKRDLSNQHIKAILQEIISQYDLCFKCAYGHYSSKCNVRGIIYQNLQSHFARILINDGLNKWMSLIKKEYTPSQLTSEAQKEVQQEVQQKVQQKVLQKLQQEKLKEITQEVIKEIKQEVQNDQGGF